MKKYIQYCKAKCHPIITEAAGKVLTSSYVKIRDDVRNTPSSSGSDKTQSSSPSPIPITVRQLEALVRISESLARMRLDSKVRVDDANEALRLFRVSTMAANSTDQGSLDFKIAGSSNKEEIERVNQLLQSRLPKGRTVNKQNLLEEASKLGYGSNIVTRVLTVMVMQGRVIETNKGRLLKRIT